MLAAAQEGHLEALRALLAAGAAVDKAAEDGASTLYATTLDGHADTLMGMLTQFAAQLRTFTTATLRPVVEALFT